MISHLKKKTAYPAAIFVDDSDKKLSIGLCQ
jgi:hypothetical protein